MDKEFIYNLERRILRLEQQVEEIRSRERELKSRLSNDEQTTLPEGVAGKMSAGINPLRSIRQSRRLTQSELSELSGVGVNYISRIENGNGFGLQTAQRLAKALNVRVEDLSPK